MTEQVLRSRRSCLATPGSNPRFLAKAKGLDADQVFLDLEDSVAPIAKADARKNIVAALNEGGWGDKLRVVRVNDWTTEWTYADVIEVVEGAGANLDCIMLPKVQTAEQVVALDLLLTQMEKVHGYEPGRIGIEAQIENALGLTNVNAIAQASPRVETIIFGPADFMAVDQHEVAGGRRAAARVRRRRRLPLHPDADPDGRAGARQAGDRRPVPADQGCRGLPPRRGPLGRARLRRQVGAAPRPDRRRQRGLLARARTTTTTPRTSSTPTTTTPRRQAAPAARSCSATR